jgi:peroxiredoxin
MTSIKTHAKRLFILPYLLACALVSLQSLYVLWTAESMSLSWLGALISVAPLVIFVILTYTFPYARTPKYMILQVVAALTGAGLAVIEMRPLPTFYALVLGLGGVLIYVFWYSYLDRDDSALLQAGKRLPPFAFQDLQGEERSSTEFLGQRVLYVFFRGDWCPLCRGQLKELADYCDEFIRRGVKVVLISPQPRSNMLRVAEHLDPRMHLFYDAGNRAAETLGIAHHGGVPFGLWHYGRDTVWPTSLLVDAGGVLQLADLPINFRFRARPAQIFDALDRLEVI